MSPRKLPLLLALFACLALAACGGDDNAVSSDASVQELINKTFSGDKKIDSGKFDMSLTATATGGELQGPINVKISGPFQSQGKGKLPKFDIDASFEGAGQSFRGGLATTGDKGFVAFNGTEYVVSDEVFAQFKKGFEDAQKQGESQNQSLASLGLHPDKWLENPKKAGEAKVGDADTIKITGDVDVDAVLADVNTALGKIRSLGVQGASQVPSKITDAQIQQVKEAVKRLAVEIYTGKDDAILRRFVVDAAVENPEASGDAESATFKFDIQLLDLNKGQDIAAPENPKPFNDLLSQLGPLLGGLGGAGGTTGSGSGSAGSGSSSGSSGSAGGATDEALKKYSDCIAAAGSDVEKARECSELLAG